MMWIRNSISKIVSVYVILLIAVFPLYVTNQYYAIQEDKINYILVSTYCMVICSLMAFLVGIAFSSMKHRRLDELRALAGYIGGSRTLPVVLGFCFLIVIAISTLCSKWRYEAFWGTMGRCQGCYLWAIYLIAFFMIAFFYEPKRWHMDLFILIGFLISVWGILDYLYLSPIGWQETVENYAKLDFSSGFGNINVLTAAEGIYLVTTAAMWVRERGRARSILYFIVCVTHIVALTVGYSDNAIISIAISLVFLPFYAFRDKKGVIRYFLLYPGYAFALFLVSLFAVSPDAWPDMRAVRDGILYDFSRTHGVYCIVILAGCLLLAAIVWIAMRMIPNGIDEKKLSLRLKAVWGGVIALGVMVGLYILYDANIAGHADRYGSLQNLLVFNDQWGTYRGFNWRLAFGYIKGFSLRELLFGTGLETYTLYTFSYDFYTMIDELGAIFDSPHNEWIQMLFTSGILGFMSWFGMHLSAIVGGWRIRDESLSQAAAALSFGLTAYLFVSLVNVSTPNLSGVTILCLGMAAAYLRVSKTDGP